MYEILFILSSISEIILGNFSTILWLVDAAPPPHTLVTFVIFVVVTPTEHHKYKIDPFHLIPFCKCGTKDKLYLWRTSKKEGWSPAELEQT